MFIFCLLTLFIAVAEVESHSIVCTALSFDSVRVAWMYDWTDFTDLEKDDIYVYYVISWFTIEELQGADEDFRETVDYQYTSDIIRYSYDEDYATVLEDVAASFGFSSFYYIIVDEKNFAEITLGLVPDYTLDIAVRRIFKSTNQRPDSSTRDADPLRCSVKIPNYSGPTTPHSSTLSTVSLNVDVSSQWMWIVVIPGILLMMIILFVGIHTTLRLVRRLRSRSKVGLIATSWAAASNNGEGRHWVVPEQTRPPSSRDGTSLDYTRSSLISGNSETWDQLHYRYQLPTVEEEPDTLDGAVFPQRKALVSHPHGKYGHRRISTPQVHQTAPDKFRLTKHNPNRVLNSGSTTLWWSDEDTDEEAQNVHKRWRPFSRERQHRRVAPLNHREKSNIFDTDEEKSYLVGGGEYGSQYHSGRSENLNRLSKRKTSTFPKKRLRSTKSSMNILSL